jgi:1,4-dihydroxy-6-naphthoate synthase
MRAHAQEHSDDVLDAHVALYVNDWTRELGPAGRAALDTLRERACAGGVLDPQTARLAVFEERADLSRRTPSR